MKYLALIAILLLPILTIAAESTYTPLVGIPGVDPDADFDKYINTLYALSISIAALLAVIKIVVAGVKWMMTDIVTSKSEAKKDIQGALLGLLIVLGAVLIITVINPDILKVDLNLNKASTQNTSGTSGTSPAGPALVIPYTTNPNGSDLILTVNQNEKIQCETVNVSVCNNNPAALECFAGEFYPSGESFVCIKRGTN